MAADVVSDRGADGLRHLGEIGQDSLNRRLADVGPALDETTGALVSQAPPNDGVLNTIGSLGIKINGPVAFNIISAKADDNAAWLVTDGAAYTVDLKTGKATMAGKINGLSGKLTDIAYWD